MTSRVYAFLVAMGLAVGLVACPPHTSVDAPASPDAESPFDKAAVASVRAYLHTLKLDEKDLSAGLSIPFSSRDAWSGTATATGRTGPHGHEVYLVVVTPTEYYFKRFMEIAPEPGPAADPIATPAPPAPTVR
jgi:hypothetical protein